MSICTSCPAIGQSIIGNCESCVATNPQPDFKAMVDNPKKDVRVQGYPVPQMVIGRVIYLSTIHPKFLPYVKVGVEFNGILILAD